MNREELEMLLTELDEALVQAFPGPEPMRVLVVGGACLLFTGTTTRPTQDIDVIVTDLFGTGEASLVYNLTKTTRKVRKIIEGIGKSHGLYKDEKMFLNDDCAPFLIELGPIPPARLLREYRKLTLYIPDDLSYILACKLIAGRANKDFGDIAVLRKLLNVSTREQARDIVSRFFPDHTLQEFYDLAKNLDEIFRGEQ
ncbi:MAG TPA: hypothetical protein VGL94_16670 [Ktedonobacteraceae bacterium]